MYKRKKNIDKKRIDQMDSYVVGIDLGEKKVTLPIWHRMVT
jgi:hypothetical protein